MSGADTSHRDYVGALFRSHYAWLCSRLYRQLDSRAHAEDIAADTFAQHLMYQLWRRRDLERAYLDVLDNDEAFSVPSPENLAQTCEALQAVDQWLDGLPAKVRATFLLSRLNGLTYPAIAAELEVSQRSVSDYMARALNVRLRLRLE
ncbi:sigma factor-like helix-turn-helix DNA-binding protein [Pseudomonas synxantha]|uniref:sigma factor-like helix-turn-helix DNA-binding protein n=1 Tax=Pseudomonas synxantha TaxID=47883 RepID=UPI000F565E38|nr:sigma factor-like helix-turn-helix DNA-binding protein [Pseudomonas synxantha]AZE80191.1 RNA polymerase sigma-70 factor [Pseudomonas synxantha]